MSLPTDAKERKALPICTGVLDYFPDALAEVARVSKVGNDQHNPGEPLHWDKSKSTDEADSLIRHLMQRGEVDKDGTLHSAKVVWRALALLQRELDVWNAAASVAYTELPEGKVYITRTAIGPEPPRDGGTTSTPRSDSNSYLRGTGVLAGDPGRHSEGKRSEPVGERRG